MALGDARIQDTHHCNTDACKKGRVEMGGTSVKPSRTIKPGDIIDVRKPPITYTFRVTGLSENRLGQLVPDYLENLTRKSQYDLLEMTRIRIRRPTKSDSKTDETRRTRDKPLPKKRHTPTRSSSTGKTQTTTPESIE